MNRTTRTVAGVVAGALVGAAVGFHVAARWAFAVLTAPDAVGQMMRDLRAERSGADSPTRCDVCGRGWGVHDAECHRLAAAGDWKDARRVWAMPAARRERWLRRRGIDRY